MNENRLLTVKECAAYLRISKSQAYLLIQKRELPYIRLSERRIVIRESDLEKWVEKKADGAKWTTLGF